MDQERQISPNQETEVLESLRAEIEKAEPSKRSRILEKFFLAALGSIPWVGGVLSAAETYRTEESANKLNHLQTEWLKEHQRKIRELAETLQKIGNRLGNLGDEIDERIQSEEYLSLVRKAFRIWDESDTSEKRRLLSNVITNAAGTKACSDDVIRLFLDWIKLYNEVHFAVIREIFENPGSTRYDIWSGLYGETPREDSSAADLYKFLIRELSTGGVVRQERDVNAVGQFVRKRPRFVRRGAAPTTLESAFEDTKPYVLTALGKEFVHYTMNEIVHRITDETGAQPTTNG
jgi:DNA-binding transcriptional MerR regulator